MGIIPPKKSELRFFLCPFSEYGLYFVKKFMHISLMVLKLCADTIFILKDTKEHNSVKEVAVLMSLVFSTLSDNALYYYQGSWKNIERSQEF